MAKRRRLLEDLIELHELTDLKEILKKETKKEEKKDEKKGKFSPWQVYLMAVLAYPIIGPSYVLLVRLSWELTTHLITGK